MQMIDRSNKAGWGRQIVSLLLMARSSLVKLLVPRRYLDRRRIRHQVQIANLVSPISGWIKNGSLQRECSVGIIILTSQIHSAVFNSQRRFPATSSTISSADDREPILKNDHRDTRRRDTSHRDGVAREALNILGYNFHHSFDLIPHCPELLPVKTG